MFARQCISYPNCPQRIFSEAEAYEEDSQIESSLTLWVVHRTRYKTAIHQNFTAESWSVYQGIGTMQVEGRPWIAQCDSTRTWFQDLESAVKLPTIRRGSRINSGKSTHSRSTIDHGVISVTNGPNKVWIHRSYASISLGLSKPCGSNHRWVDMNS